MSVRTGLTILLLLLAAPGLRGFGAEPVDYLRDVKAVLRERCFACHGPLKQEAGLRLDTAADMRTGGDSGAIVEPPRRANDSLLLHRVTAAEDERMPPEGEPLSVEQIAALRAWIEAGAVAPADEERDPDPRDHWSFRPPVKSPIPRIEHEDWSRNPIDAFLAAEHERHGLVPVEEVDGSLLLRRVYLDLVGLPPTRAELEAFLADESPDAYERVVDRLLTSPRHGERWGRHWMDVWRYSDWYGLGAQVRNSQKHVWHWRDWIVESLNDDRGYDRMVVEMLAADEIAPTDRDTLRATGFLARNYYLFNRTTWLDDTLEHTSKAFLGLTLNCAKCHDHKYDPITHRDYYAMRAIFEPHQIRLDTWPGETDLERDGLPRAFDAHPDARTWLHLRGDPKNPDESAPIPPSVPAFLLGNDRLESEPIELPPVAHRPELREFVLADHVRDAENEVAKRRTALDAARTVLARAESRDAADDAPESSAGPVVLVDDFDREAPDVWRYVDGEWSHRDGRLVQSRVGAKRAYLRSSKPHPTDLHAVLQFRITGGEKWKSVGIAFDVADDRDTLVYVSGVAGGSKVQVAHRNGMSSTYPPGGARSIPVETGRDHVLDVRVRDRLVNVRFDDRLLLAYTLTIPRQPGAIDLVAFDAAVEFDRFELRELPDDAPLVAKFGETSEPVSVDGARHAVTIAARALEVAELRIPALRTGHAADRAGAFGETDDRVAELVHEAALAARQLEHARAELTLAEAESKLAAADDESRGQATKELETARTKLGAAERAIESPGEKYESIVATRKAPEGPDESAESQRAAYPTTSTGRRTALARWIVARDNPLAARVAVNHVWLRHFGQPLVENVEDLGTRSPAPPLQSLLDWLAVDLMEHGWSLRRLHRLIVTSRAYRLSTSTLDADVGTLAADPDNRFHWRRQPTRMESQVVRDSLLHLAGALDERLGGPSLEAKTGTRRRSLYLVHSRDGRDPFLAMFDDADILRCYRRSESIIPQQALTLANSRLSLEMARRLSARLQADLGEVPDDRFVDEAFLVILARRPTDREREACLDALTATRELLAENGHATPSQRARENLVHAVLNHNDFVTIR